GPVRDRAGNYGPRRPPSLPRVRDVGQLLRPDLRTGQEDRLAGRVPGVVVHRSLRTGGLNRPAVTATGLRWRIGLIVSDGAVVYPSVGDCPRLAAIPSVSRPAAVADGIRTQFWRHHGFALF